MNTHDIDIELPPLPPGYVSYEFPDGGYDADELRTYALAAIEPYKQCIAELEAELQELQRQWVEHDTLGCPTAKTGIYAIDHARRVEGDGE